MIHVINPRKEQFEDVVGKVEFKPLNTPDNYFSGFYLPIVNGQSLQPISQNYSLIKTKDVRDLILDILPQHGLNVKKEKTLNFGKYHKHVIVLDKKYQISEKPFELELLEDFEMDLSPYIDYNPSNNNGDWLGSMIEIYNSYCGHCRFFITTKIIRFICVNGVIVGDKLEELMIKHNKSSFTIEDEIKILVPQMVENLERLYLEYLPKFQQKIKYEDAINILERANKLGVSKRYLKEIKEKVIEKLYHKIAMVKLWIIWNLITYNIERNKSLYNIAGRPYNIYKQLMKEI